MTEDGAPDVGDIAVRTTSDGAGRPVTVVLGEDVTAADALEAMRNDAREQAELVLSDRPVPRWLDGARFEVVGVQFVPGTGGAAPIPGGAHPPRWCAYGTLTAVPGGPVS